MDRLLLIVLAYLATGVIVFGVAETWVTFGRDGVVRRLPTIASALVVLLVAFAIVWYITNNGLDPLVLGLAAVGVLVVSTLWQRRHPRPPTDAQAARAVAMRTPRGRLLRTAEVVWLVGLVIGVPVLAAFLASQS